MKRVYGFCVCLIFFVGLALSFVNAKGVSSPTIKRKEVTLPKKGKEMPTKKSRLTPSALGQKIPYPRTAFLKLQKYGKIPGPDGIEMKLIKENEFRKSRDIP